MVTLQGFIDAVKELGYEPAVAEELFNWLRSRPGTLGLRKGDLEFLQKWENSKRDKKQKAGTLHVGWINRDPSAAVEYRKMADRLAEKHGQRRNQEQRVSECPSCVRTATRPSLVPELQCYIVFAEDIVHGHGYGHFQGCR